MPHKMKDTATKKPALQIVRQSISNSSLNYIPTDVIEGFQERIETGINWMLSEEAARYHRTKCSQPNLAELKFSEALQNKINKSILQGFLEESNISLADQWECILPMVLWDKTKFSNEEASLCFDADNSITDNMIQLVKKAVQLNDRSVLRNEFFNITVLRLIGTKMTDLDKGLQKFEKLHTLNLCGNFITSLNTDVIPRGLKILELQSNHISNVEFAENLPLNLIYLGLAKNFLNDESVSGLMKLRYISVLDLSDNDIYDLNEVLRSLIMLPKLISLSLAGNPCAVCAAYARTTVMRLTQLQWLDSREVIDKDRSLDVFEPHPDDLRSAYFNFTVFRIMSVPPPPKSEKGAITTFHVELELPLLDSMRRTFLMYRDNESLTECLPPPEDEDWVPEKIFTSVGSKINADSQGSCTESDIYNRLVAKNSRIIRHYKVFESNRIQWNKIMNFQEPAIRIFCPNLIALRDTFRTVVTVRLVYTVTTTSKQAKGDKKSAHTFKQPSEYTVTLATVKCSLKAPDWTRASQHFHWDDTLGTDEAVHWGDGDLSVLQYSLGGMKAPKAKPESEISSKLLPPDNLTCHFGFGIDTIRQ